ncbi:MAG: hypothetical protein VXZ73_00940 [Pseudomonadota bacterium]|nr:hypothetical protein [Pseudomonadota bacterium]MEC8978220.1 hypothetical protein [Pseudomonadota bacterium]
MSDKIKSVLEGMKKTLVSTVSYAKKLKETTTTGGIFSKGRPDFTQIQEEAARVQELLHKLYQRVVANKPNIRSSSGR